MQPTHFLPSPTPAPQAALAADWTVQRVLDFWRGAIDGADPLERAYLFVQLLQDARLLRRAAEFALPLGRWTCPATGRTIAPWWAGLLPKPRDPWVAPSLLRAVREQAFWHRLGGLPPLPGLSVERLENLSVQSPKQALEWARNAALLREGPDGHATLALAELALGRLDIAARRLAGLSAWDWRATADDPVRVGQSLCLGRAVLADAGGDYGTLRRELQAMGALEQCPLTLLAALYVLHMREGDDEGLERLRRETVGRREGAERAWQRTPDLPLNRWSKDFGTGARLRLSYALEHDTGTLGEVAHSLAACVARS